MIRIFGIGFVFRTVDQVEMKTVEPLANDDSFFGQGNSRIGGIGEIGHEDALPDGGSLCALDVLDVDHDLGKSFIENARLNFERDLRALQAVFEMAERSLRPGSDIHTVDQSEKPCANDENREDPEETPYAHAAGAHGCDFAVGGETAQADQDSDQNAHG